jgi:hypothetical protein
MRKQYHFRPGVSGLNAWDVDRLIRLVEDAPTEQVALSEISELDSNYWFDHGYLPTVRSSGRVMDGMHRVARALLEKRLTVHAKRLPFLPEPDFIDCRPDELPY